MAVSVPRLTAIQKWPHVPELNFILLFVSTAYSNLTELLAPVVYFFPKLNFSVVVARKGVVLLQHVFPPLYDISAQQVLPLTIGFSRWRDHIIIDKS
jgi:hypothetical protein